MSQRRMGEEHPAEKMVPLLLHAIIISQCEDSPRVDFIAMGGDDSMAHLRGACSVIPMNLHPKFIEELLLIEDPTQKQKRALEGVARAVEDYLNMKAPIWGELKEYIDALDPLQVGEAWPRAANYSWVELAAPSLKKHLSTLDSKVNRQIWESAIPHYRKHIAIPIRRAERIAFLSPRELLERDLTTRENLIKGTLFADPPCSWSDHPGALPIDYFSPPEQQALEHLTIAMNSMVRSKATYLEGIPLKNLTWGRLLDLAFLAREYNVEWAVASMEW